MSNIDLSIIIPVYNVEQYLHVCIDSVLAAVRNLKSIQKCEIICVDDGATDSCGSILDAYSLHEMPDNAYFKVVHKANGGLSDARNTGLELAKGKYIYFLDSDDSITPDTFFGMLELVRMHPGVDVVVAGAMTSEGNTRFSMTTRKHYPEYTEDREWIKCMMILQNIPMVAWNKLLRREMIINANLRFEVGLYNEDESWNWMLAKSVNSIAFYPHDTYYYLIRQGSIINNPAIYEKRWKDAMRYVRIWLNNVDDFLQDTQRYYIFYYIYGWLLSPPPYATNSDIKFLFKELSLQCSWRQCFAIWLATHIPLFILRNVGPVQFLLIDVFGQGECSKYDERGLLSYIK